MVFHEKKQMTRNKEVPENKSWANQQEMNYGLTVHYVTNVGFLERQKKIFGQPR